MPEIRPNPHEMVRGKATWQTDHGLPIDSIVRRTIWGRSWAKQTPVQYECSRSTAQRPDVSAIGVALIVRVTPLQLANPLETEGLIPS